MDYDVYFDKRRIKLTDDLDDSGDYTVFSYKQSNVPSLLFRLESGEFDKILFYHHQPEVAWSNFLQFFDIIRASGGIVFNEKKEILFIYRRGIWDLPKGKINPDEDPAQAALREVKEECGINELSLIKYFKDSYHVFWEGKRRKMKITNWFLMYAPSTQPLIPEKREGIEKVEWLSPVLIDARLSTYNNIKDLTAELDISDLKPEVK